MDEREIIGVVENHNRLIVGNEIKKRETEWGITPYMKKSRTKYTNIHLAYLLQAIFAIRGRT